MEPARDKAVQEQQLEQEHEQRAEAGAQAGARTLKWQQSSRPRLILKPLVLSVYRARRVKLLGEGVVSRC